jgi:hypothetical protein
MNPARPTLMVELDEPTVTAHLDRVQPWLATTKTLQATFRKALEDTADDVEEPHTRTWLHELLVPAQEHEDAVDHRYRGVRPRPGRRWRPRVGGLDRARSRDPLPPGRLSAAPARLPVRGSWCWWTSCSRCRRAW